MIHGTGTHSVDPSVVDDNNIIERCFFYMNYPVNEYCSIFVQTLFFFNKML